jgi:hypothetical protein
VTTPTWTEIRDQAKTAIYAITQQNVESFTVNGTVYRRHDLDKLVRLVKAANEMIEMETTTGKTAVVAFREPG